MSLVTSGAPRKPLDALRKALVMLGMLRKPLVTLGTLRKFLTYLLLKVKVILIL